MINELSVHLKATNNKAKIAFWTLMALSLADFSAYMLMRFLQIQKSGLVGLLALAFITLGVLIYTKYVSSEYYYDVTHDSEGYAIFVVRQVVGKRGSTLCRIGLSEIVKAVRETKEERRAHKTPVSHKKYVYVPTLFPETTYRLTTRSRYEQAEIVIEASDDFVNLLMQYVSEAKELEALNEE